MNNVKRLISILLALCLLMVCLPLSASAAEYGTEAELISATIASVTVRPIGHNLFFLLPPETDTTALPITFEVSHNATVSYDGFGNPIAEGATYDFSAPQNFTVLSEDGKTANTYAIQVLASASSNSETGKVRMADGKTNYTVGDSLLVEIDAPEGIHVSYGSLLFHNREENRDIECFMCIHNDEQGVILFMDSADERFLVSPFYSGTWTISSITLWNSVGQFVSIVDRQDYENISFIVNDIDDEDTAVRYDIYGDKTAYFVFDKSSGTIIRSRGVCSGTLPIPAAIDGVPVTTIGKQAFKGLRGDTTSVILPEGITKIEGDVWNGAFSRLAISDIVLPNSLEFIDDGVFSECFSLRSITLPKNLKSLGHGVFEGCYSLREINVDIENSYFTSVSGVLFNKDMTKIICYPQGKTDASYTIPHTVKIIGNDAFHNSALASLSIPEGIEELEDHYWLPHSDGSYGSFSGAQNLTSITLPNSLRTIGAGAFAGAGFKTIVIPSAVENIGDRTFKYSRIEEVVFSEGITALPLGTFFFCSNLKSISLPKSLIKIDNNSFVECNNLTDVFFQGNKKQWENIAIGDGNENLLGATIHYKDNAPTPTPSTPGPQPSEEPAPSPDEPTVKMETAIDGTTTTTITYPDGKEVVAIKSPEGDLTVDVTSSTGDVIAKVNLPAEPAPAKDFSDVPSDSWYADAVDTASGYGLFSGTGANTFSPAAPMTRGMLVQVLYNLSGRVDYGEDSRFADVTETDWYADAVDWAAAVGVTSGTGNGFSPN